MLRHSVHTITLCLMKCGGLQCLLRTKLGHRNREREGADACVWDWVSFEIFKYYDDDFFGTLIKMILYFVFFYLSKEAKMSNVV